MCGRPHPLALPHRLYVLLQLSTIFRVVALYHPQLQVLPELLYVLLLLLPTVMVRVGMLDKYAAFAAAVRAGQPYVPSVAASDTNGMRDAKHAATDIEADGSWS